MDILAGKDEHLKSEKWVREKITYFGLRMRFQETGRTSHKKIQDTSGYMVVYLRKGAYRERELIRGNMVFCFVALLLP